MRRWLFQIWVEFPDNVVEDDLGSVLLGNIKFLISRNRLPEHKKTDYVLYGIVESNDPLSMLSEVGGRAETILDMLAFQFQRHIPMQSFQVLDMSDPVRKGDVRELVIGNKFPRLQKDSGIDLLEMWSTEFNHELLKKELDESTAATLRWFSKGLSTRIVVDRFSSFWIALEIFTSPSKPRKKVFFKCRRCSYQINSCPSCGRSTEYFPDSKERIQDHIVEKLKLDKTVFERLWNARQLFHGQNRLREEDISKVSDATFEMRSILVFSLKERLGLKQNEKPLQLRAPRILFGEMILPGATRQVTEADISYARSA